MCIIAIKNAGIAMPSDDIIANMFYANPDGAGFMYSDGKKVQIRKGFMTLNDFRKAIDQLAKTHDLKHTPLIMHFRITTHGGTCPSNTHPFPVTDNINLLKSTKLPASLGVAHNGIIRSVTPRSGISDTMEYIATQLAPLTRAVPNWYADRDLLDMVSNAIKSKMAVLNPQGNITTIGDFIEDKGILYSNTSYKGYGARYSTPVSNTAVCTKTTTSKGKQFKLDPLPMKRVMLIDEKYPGAYVQEPKTGWLDDGADYAIDKDGTVYLLDTWGAERTSSLIALTPEGMPCKFDDDFAFSEYVI